MTCLSPEAQNFIIYGCRMFRATNSSLSLILFYLKHVFAIHVLNRIDNVTLIIYSLLMLGHKALSLFVFVPTFFKSVPPSFLTRLDFVDQLSIVIKMLLFLF